METGTSLTRPVDPGRLSKIVASPLTWFLLVGVLVAGLRFGVSGPPPPPTVPSYGQVPEFSFTDQDGRPFSSQTLAGQTWVAEFFFTHCPTICVELTRAMKQLDTQLPPGVGLVSITVDPEQDSPEVLRNYIQKNAIDTRRWTFLTGPLHQVEAAVVQGFKLPMQKADPSEGQDLMAITHGSRLVLVDGQRRIRGYFEANPAGLLELRVAAERVASEQK